MKLLLIALPAIPVVLMIATVISTSMKIKKADCELTRLRNIKLRDIVWK